MEAKEKARELVEKFRLHSFPSNNNYDAKQCASICAQEIISHIQRRVDALHDTTDVTDLKYWEKVLTEIQSL